MRADGCIIGVHRHVVPVGKKKPGDEAREKKKHDVRLPYTTTQLRQPLKQLLLPLHLLLLQHVRKRGRQLRPRNSALRLLLVHVRDPIPVPFLFVIVVVAVVALIIIRVATQDDRSALNTVLTIDV